MDTSFEAKNIFFEYKAEYAQVAQENKKRQPQIAKLPHFMLVALVPVNLSTNIVAVGI